MGATTTLVAILTRAFVAVAAATDPGIPLIDTGVRGDAFSAAMTEQAEPEPVAIIEDDPDLASAMHELLQAAGFDPLVLSASDEDLPTLLAAARPRVIVTDFVRCDASRIGLPDALIPDHRGGLPIVVFTAWHPAQWPAGAGAPIVRKPDLDGLLRAIGVVTSSTARPAALAQLATRRPPSRARPSPRPRPLEASND